MTAITVGGSSIPSEIDSLEKLATWAILSLQRVNPDRTVLLNGSQTGRAAEYSLFQGGDDEIYFSGRVVLKLATGYSSDTSVRFWEHAQPISNTALPQALTQNAS